MGRSLDSLALLHLWLVVGCHPPNVGPADAGTSSGNTSSTTEESSTSETPNDMNPETCGDGIVNGLEECEPSGPVPCADDCTLPPDGPGSIEWLFIDDDRSQANAVAVDAEGRATVAGTHFIDDASLAWLARFEPDGTLAWEVEHDGDGVGAMATDVRLNSKGDAIVVGSVGTSDPNEWVTAHDAEGMPLWSWSGTIDEYHGQAEAVAILDDQIYVGVSAFSINDEDAFPEMRLMALSADGVPQTTRTWAPSHAARIESLAAESTVGQIIQVGMWLEGNWLEALDANMETLWTDNELVQVPSEGSWGNATVYDVDVDAEGGIYVVGYEAYVFISQSPGLPDVNYVRKLSANGDADWVVFPSPPGAPTVAFADGTVYMADASDPFGGLTFWAFDATTGALQWKRHVPLADGIDFAIDLRASLDSLWVVGTRRVVAETFDVHGYVARLRRN